MMTPKMLLKTGLILLHDMVDPLQLVVQKAQHLQAARALHLELNYQPLSVQV